MIVCNSGKFNFQDLIAHRPAFFAGICGHLRPKTFFRAPAPRTPQAARPSIVSESKIFSVLGVYLAAGACLLCARTSPAAAGGCLFSSISGNCQLKRIGG